MAAPAPAAAAAAAAAFAAAAAARRASCRVPGGSGKVAVLLRRPFDLLGHAGAEVAVAPGYARNFLVPRGVAVYATALNRARFAAAPLAGDAARAADAARAQRLLRARVAAVVLTVRRASKDGAALYGTVTAADIAAQLEATPLRNLGVREAGVRVPGGGLGRLGVHAVEVEPRAMPGQWFELKVHVMSS